MSLQEELGGGRGNHRPRKLASPDTTPVMYQRQSWLLDLGKVWVTGGGAGDPGRSLRKDIQVDPPGMGRSIGGRSGVSLVLQGGDSHEAHGQVPWGWPSVGAGPVLLIGLMGQGSQQSRVGAAGASATQYGGSAQPPWRSPVPGPGQWFSKGTLELGFTPHSVTETRGWCQPSAVPQAGLVSRKPLPGRRRLEPSLPFPVRMFLVCRWNT